MLDKPQAFVILEKFPQPLKASVMPDHTTNPRQKEHTALINRMIRKENTKVDRGAYITNISPLQILLLLTREFVRILYTKMNEHNNFKNPYDVDRIPFYDLIFLVSSM